MKRLIIVRHGDATAKVGVSDKSRTLSSTGEIQSIALAKELERLGIIPDTIISSDALRTKQTAFHMMRTWFIDLDELVINADIYYGDEKKYLTIIEQTDENSNTIMLVGHNPTISHFASLITFEPLNRFNFPNCGCMIWEFEAFKEIRKEPKLIFSNVS